MPKSNDIDNHAKEAVWTSKKKRFSTVWIVPVVALLIGATLIFKAISEKGPEIRIIFKSAAGIQAGKSVVKYKDIEVGKVTDVKFSDDLKSVIVTAELKKYMSAYLNSKTQFWVVHARLSADAVEGLDTLLSGAYIGMEPHSGSDKVKEFTGLKEPPLISNREKGKHFILEADDKGSIQAGSPIYYKKIKVGLVTSYKLDKDNNRVLLNIFIKAPYDKLVTTTTRFWDTSGIYASIGAEGVEIRTESLTAILSGGIAFGNFEEFQKGKTAPQNKHFILFRSIKEAKAINYKRKLYFWVYFQHSIRGLKIGAPVEFRGVKIGEVVNFMLIGNADSAEFEIPILIRIEPERFTIIGETKSKDDSVNPKVFAKLVEKGLRAQLQSSSLITGDLLVNLDFYDNVPEAKLIKKNGLYVMPTVPAIIETLKSDIQTLLTRLSKIPFEQIGEDISDSVKLIKTETIPSINSAIESVDSLLKESNNTVSGFNKSTLPKLNKTLKETAKALNSLRRNYLDKDSQANKRLIQLLEEATRATRSIKNLTDYLERHPESLIRGK